jgi:hypothetical protein
MHRTRCRSASQLLARGSGSVLGARGSGSVLGARGSGLGLGASTSRARRRRQTASGKIWSRRSDLNRGPADYESLHTIRNTRFLRNFARSGCSRLRIVPSRRNPDATQTPASFSCSQLSGFGRLTAGNREQEYVQHYQILRRENRFLFSCSHILLGTREQESLEGSRALLRGLVGEARNAPAYLVGPPHTLSRPERLAQEPEVLASAVTSAGPATPHCHGIPAEVPGLYPVAGLGGRRFQLPGAAVDGGDCWKNRPALEGERRPDGGLV